MTMAQLPTVDHNATQGGSMHTLTPQQRDRAHGVLIGTAIGDALGAPIEFQPPVHYPTPITMTGGGGFNWAPGEWTDDTSMAIIIAQALAAHGTLADGPALDAIAAGFHDWAETAPDVGVQTSSTLRTARRQGHDASALAAAAAAFTAAAPDRAGNGSLMRTAPVVLAGLFDDEVLADRAVAVSALTHAAVDATEACVLWCMGMQQAVLHGTLAAARAGLLAGLAHVAPERRELWQARIVEAEGAEPWDFPHNGWVVHAFQAAWAAVTCTVEHDGAPGAAFARGIDHAVRCGSDTDTVAAIAGGMLGALFGASAAPTEWLDIVHGWPGLTGADLRALTDEILNGGVA